MAEDETTDSTSESQSPSLPSGEPVTDRSETEDSPEKKRETTRSEIAKFYVYGFFGVLGITFVVGLWQAFEVEDYRDMLITVSGILSGPLGFIIGYYFKASTMKE